jgi:hypothetical protein
MAMKGKTKSARAAGDGAGSGADADAILARPRYVPADLWLEIMNALAPLDRLAREMERKWGCGRLPSLVEPELAARFGRAQDKLNEAIRLNDATDIARRVGVVMRGWEALDAAAMEIGAERLPARTIGVEHGGRAWVIVLDPVDYDKARADHIGGGQVVALAELIEAYKIVSGRIAGVLEAFPGAQIRAPSGARLDDPLPF